MGLAEDVLRGAPRAVARTLSLIERGGEEAAELLDALRPATGRARTVGLTGAPGVGKSSLVEAIGVRLLAGGERVAVLAVDPSSPFTGGALLGDRVRMTHFPAAGGFVRSMATRGAVGGLAAATADAIDVLDAAGFAWVLVETVGVGQDEVDVAGVVDTVVVVTLAGMGDDVQAGKARLLEVADVFAVNKADRGGAESEVAALEGMLAMAPPAAWRPPIIPTSATTGTAIDRLIAALVEHQSFLEHDGRRERLRRARAAARLERIVAADLWRRITSASAGELERIVSEVVEGRLGVYRAARSLLDAGLRGGDQEE